MVQLVDCPACGLQVAVELESIRTTNERLDEGESLRVVIFIARGLDCPVCGLELRSTAEMKAAGLPQQYTHTETESFEERIHVVVRAGRLRQRLSRTGHAYD